MPVSDRTRRAPSLALVLVRNTVTHDARVLREAETLGRLGFEVLVVGVVSTEESVTSAEVAGARVVRLAPGTATRRVLRSRRAAGAPPTRRAEGARGSPVAAASASAPARGAGGLRGRLWRLGVTLAYYLLGVRFVLHARPALVHANDYNTMWIGIAAKALRRSRLIYDCHELWPDRNGRREWRPWLLACEALFVRVADATITTSPGYAAAIARRYRVRPPTLVRNIPAPTLPPQSRRRDPGRSDPLAIYIGGLMPGRGLENAIRALALVPELRLRLTGPGHEAYRRALLGAATEVGVADRVEIRAAVPPAAVLGAIADADFGLMLIEPVCRSYELTLPNKLFEYATAGIPVLASDLPVIGPLVRESGIGEVVAADDVEQIAAGLRRLAQPATNARRRCRVSSFREQFTWERERQVLERVYVASSEACASR